MTCAYCRGTGWIEVPDDDGESAYETACPNCDGPDEDKSYMAWRYPAAMTEVERPY